MNREIGLLLCNIIQAELALTSDRIWIYNQAKKIPIDENLFIVVRQINSRVWANRNIPSPILSGMNAITTLNTVEEYSIDIASVNAQARQRKEEVILALNSTFSLQQQEKYNFRIALIPTNFLNISSVEGSRMLTRFTINVRVYGVYTKTQAVEYYDNFTHEEIIDY